MHSSSGIPPNTLIQMLLGDVFPMPISPILSTRQPSAMHASAISAPTAMARSYCSSVIAAS